MSSKMELTIGPLGRYAGRHNARDDGGVSVSDEGAPRMKLVVAPATGDDEADEVAVIHRLDAALGALDDVDFSSWSDESLEDHLDEVSVVLCRVDAQLSRLADAVRSRGFAIAEPDLPLAS